MAFLKSGQVILCTGANRSLGFAILQATALRLPSATYILGSREAAAGHSAAQELQKLGVIATIEVLELDVSKDESIFAAVESVTEKHGKLDVLINNAGIASIPASLSEYRSSYDSTFTTNITGVAITTAAFLPLLHKSPAPKVINISSARGSLTRSTAGKPPPTAAVAYSVSKTALNALTIEFQKTEDARVEREGQRGRTRFWAVSPGHLRTAFNGFRGTKEPLDGAEAVVRLVVKGDEEGMFEGGSFWEFEGGEMRRVPW